MKQIKKQIAILLCICMIGIFAWSPAWAEEEPAAVESAEQVADSEAAIGMFEAVLENLAMYARYDEISMTGLYREAVRRVLEEHPEMYESLMRGMLESIDEYSEYYTPEEAEELFSSVSGELLVGIGVTIDFSEDKAKVASVIPDTPAERAGIRVGDIIVGADGVDLRGAQSETVLSAVRGEEGTPVSVSLERDGVVYTVEMIREKIIGTSVESKIFSDEKQKVMYIRIYGFVDNTAELLRRALQEAVTEGATGIIMDLRDNGGGVFEQAILMADMLVPKGNVITSADHKIDVLDQTYTADAVDEIPFDIVVLVNENSASASEVLAAALQENGVAVLIGTNTFGKGTIQSIKKLELGGAIKFTVGFYLTPTGKNIHKVGLTPNVEVKNPAIPMDMSLFEEFAYNRVYRVGDSGGAVYTAKQLLKLLGGYTGEINDTFDQPLADAVSAFQDYAGLYPYGELDITTQIQLWNTVKQIKIEQDEQLKAAFSYFDMEVPEEM